MAQGDNPVVQQLEEQMERIQERLRRPQRSRGGRLALLGGLGLGAIVGGALAYFLRSREEEPIYAPPPPPPPAPPRRDDAILLRPTSTPPAPPAVAEEEDAPITLKAASAPAAAELPAEAPTTEETTDEATTDEIAPLVASDSEPPAEAEVVPTAEEPAPTTEASTAAAPEEAAAPGNDDELTDEEAIDAPVAEFYPKAEVPTDGQCPASHPIKGNINRNGLLIFHTPDSNNYARVNPEACFANEEDAEAAGFRKSRS